MDTVTADGGARSGRRIALAVAGLAAGAGFLAFALRGIDVHELGATLRAAHWLPWGVALLASALAFVAAKIVRWRILLGDLVSGGVRPLVAPVCAGLLANALLPHSGEFVRAFDVGRRQQVAVAAVLASIATERVLDFVAVLALALLALVATPTPASIAPALRVLAWIAGSLSLLVAVGIAAPAAVAAVVRRVAAPLPAAAGRFLETQSGAVLGALGELRSGHRLAAALLASLAQWCAIVGCVWLCGAVVGATYGLGSSTFVVIGLVLAFAIPNAPGYLGATQLAFVAVLAPLGIEPARAFAASVVYTLLVIGPTLLLGAFAFGAIARRR